MNTMLFVHATIGFSENLFLVHKFDPSNQSKHLIKSIHSASRLIRSENVMKMYRPVQ